MTTKHTPGPWFHLADGAVYSEKGPHKIAQAYPGNNADSEANARLIAAAPRVAAEHAELVSTARRLLENSLVTDTPLCVTVDSRDATALSALLSRNKEKNEMAASPRFKVYSSTGEYVAACKHAEDAAWLLSNYEGGTVRAGHRRVVYQDGVDPDAGESVDVATEIIHGRLNEKQ